jgi:hypothetical protein
MSDFLANHFTDQLFIISDSFQPPTSGAKAFNGFSSDDGSGYIGVEFNSIGISAVARLGRSIKYSLSKANIPAPIELNDGSYYLSCIHFHGEKKAGVELFREDFIPGLKIGSSQAEVRAQLGDPTQSSPVKISKVLGKPLNQWDKYTSDTSYYWHFEYDADLRVVHAARGVAF